MGSFIKTEAPGGKRGISKEGNKNLKRAKKRVLEVF